MNISFKKDINKSYMVIEKVREFSDNNYMIKMLSENRITGLLPIGYENINGQYNLLYDISSRQAFSKIFETQKLSFRQIRALIFSMKGLLRSLDEYLLDENNIILKQECIFADPEGEIYEYCYYPYYGGNLVLEIRELFTKMLSEVDYDDENAVRLIYEIHSEVQNENFTIDNLMTVCQNVIEDKRFSVPQTDRREFLEPAGRSREPFPMQTGIEEFQLQPEALSFEDAPGPAEDAYQPEEEQPFFERVRMYFKGNGFMDFLEDLNNGVFMEKVRHCGSVPKTPPAFVPAEGVPPAAKPEFEYVDLENDFSDIFAEDNLYVGNSRAGTVLLKQNERDNHVLVGRKSQQGVQFEISGLPFTIGKNADKSNACLQEPTVSRLHARIYGEGNVYYIEDLNSTNGTYLNEQRLSAYTKTPIEEGDILRFAAEEFCFL